MKKSFGFKIGLVLSAIFGMSGVSQAHRPSNLFSFLTPQQLEVLKNPDRVETYRLRTMDHLISSPMPSSDDARGIIARGRLLTSSEVGVLNQSILQDRVYSTALKTECKFRPAIGLRFFKGNSSLPVMFCFSCEALAVELGIDQKLIFAPFGEERKFLVDLVKKLFPKDDEIQKLTP